MKSQSLSKLAISSLVLVSMAACGGGSVTELTTQPGYTVAATSYENRHTDFQYSTNLPMRGYDARAFFKYPDGAMGYVTHTLVSGPWNTANISLAQPGTVILMKQVNGAWQDNSSAIDTTNSVPGCIHPRKVVAADFNQDKVIDFAFACHGWDGPPYPGERARILLSQANGTYQLKYQSDDVDFKHGATAADINNDGIPDLVVTAINGINVFINNGQGYFTKSSTYTVPQVRRSFHVELLDVSNDGKFDLVQGSHEWEDATRIILNRGDNDFGGSLFNRPTEITIPPIPGAGVIVDFLYIKRLNVLYILRTGDGRLNGTVFYEGVWLQKFDLNTRLSTVVYANQMYNNNGRKWITWILEKDGYVVSDYGNLLSIRIE